MASVPGLFNIQQFTDGGLLASNYRLYTYVQGTTTLKTAYTDIAALVPHTYTSDGGGGSYIALNARGELPAPLYLDIGAYDIALKRTDGSTVWTRRADPSGASGEFNFSLTYLAGTVGKWLQDLALSTGATFIGLIASGTGAVLRTLQSKARDFVSVKDFGALGDAVTNDAPAIKVSLDSGAGLITMPDGDYKLGVPLLIKNGTTRVSLPSTSDPKR